MTEQPLKAPFPYFGGKSKIASVIWERFGEVRNYVEPFFGSGAVLLANPHPQGTETVCDKDHFVANFWRAVRANPVRVTHYVDRPVSEVELQHVHHWLVTDGASRLRDIETNRYFYDAEVAGLWLWGSCSWIGSGWCSGQGPWVLTDDEWRKDGGRGINRQLPHLGNRGRGINRQLPHLGDRGRGINRQMQGQLTRREFIEHWITALAERMRDVRVTCGDWSRITGSSVTYRLGVTAIFLDPPYSAKAERCLGVYRQDDDAVAHVAAKWAMEQGDNPLMRIAFAGYDGEHDFPSTWDRHAWKTPGGYGSQGDGRGRNNSHKESIWFSPHCLPRTMSSQPASSSHQKSIVAFGVTIPVHTATKPGDSFDTG